MADEIIKVLKLKEPLQRGSEVITELKFRKPRAGDFRNMSLSPKLGEIMDAAGKMCGMLTTEMDQLCFEDMTEVSKILGEVMEHIPPIGGKP